MLLRNVFTSASANSMCWSLILLCNVHLSFIASWCLHNPSDLYSSGRLVLIVNATNLCLPRIPHVLVLSQIDLTEVPDGALKSHSE